MSDKNVVSSHKANEPLIFLDLDGVIADFEGHATAQNKFKPNGKLDYDALDYKWWSTMPAFPGARAFYDKLTSTAKTRFLTGPVLNEGCYAGKAHWVQDFVPERGKFALEDLIICDADNKSLLATPSRILIDDNADNIRNWRAAGGIGIHHTGNYQETLKQLNEAVAQIKAGAKPAPAKKIAGRLHFPKFG